MLYFISQTKLTFFLFLFDKLIHVFMNQMSYNVSALQKIAISFDQQSFPIHYENWKVIFSDSMRVILKQTSKKTKSPQSNVTSHQFNTSSNFLLVYSTVLHCFPKSFSLRKKKKMGRYIFYKVKTINKQITLTNRTISGFSI